MFKLKICCCCSDCGKEFEITIHQVEGYISFDDGGSAKYNIMSDGHNTVDFFCSDECRDG